MQHMLEVATKEGINIRWRNFKPSLQGMYWVPTNESPVIFLSNSLEGHTRQMRCVMAEELGHHYTLDRDCICRTYFSYRDRLAISRAEYRALRWAAKYLMPEDKLKIAINSGLVEGWELAEYFDIVEELIPYRMVMPDAVRAIYGSASSF